jgi:signal recognition particle GTPase
LLDERSDAFSCDVRTVCSEPVPAHRPRYRHDGTKAFGEALPLTGVVLTKTDGDARGGAALSVRYITGKPIKFVGVSEKPDGLDVFHPDRIASRILDMGDVLSLVEQVEQQVDKDKAQKLAEKVAKGKKPLLGKKSKK